MTMSKVFMTISKVVFSMILVFSLIFCSSCNRNDDPEPTHFLHEIYSHAQEDRLPPLETVDSNAVMTAPGERTPVEWLYRAPQDFVGETVNLSVDVSQWDDASSKEFLYVFEKQDSGKGKLWVLYTPKVGEQGAVMLTLETPYATADALLSETTVFSGTVTSIALIDVFDYSYPRETVCLAEDEQAPSTDGAFGYGWVRLVDDGSIDRPCYSGDSADEIGAFKITFERFGVLE